MPDPKPHREYTNEEAASIITRVLDRQNGEGGRISHDELLETAREIGVTTLELEAAVVEETRLRAQMLVREEERQRALRQLLRHVAIFVGAAAIAAVLNLKVLGGAWFVWAALLAWGVGVAVHVARVVLPSELDRQLAAREEQAKRVEVRGGKLEIRNPQG